MRRRLVWVEISEVLQWCIFWDHILGTFLLDKIEYLKEYVKFVVVLLPQVNTGYQLLNTIREDLNHVVLVCESQKKPTNYLRNLMSDLVKGKSRFVYVY